MDDVATIGRVLVSLAAVLGIMWVLARRVRRPAAGRKARTVEVLDRASLSRTASVAVVRVGERALVLGVADAQVSVLGETDLATALAARTTPAAARDTSARSRRSAGVALPEALVQRTEAVPAATLPAATVPAAVVPTAAVPTAATTAPQAAASGPLAGSALSPQTWKLAVESLRDLTSRV